MKKQKGNSLRSGEILYHAPDARSMFSRGHVQPLGSERLPKRKEPQKERGGQLCNLRRVFTTTISCMTNVFERPGVNELDPTLVSEVDGDPSVHGTASLKVEII